VQQVDSGMKLAIDRSCRLQRYMGLVAAEADSGIRMPIPAPKISGIDHQSISCSLSNPRWFEDPVWDDVRAVSPQMGETATEETKLSIELHISPSGELPRVGSRCRRIFVCQPPVTQMELILSCCSPNLADRLAGATPAQPGVPPYKPETVDRADGIRFGDLLDVARDKYAYHGCCPDCPDRMLDSDGRSELTLRFTVKIPLAHHDPI